MRPALGGELGVGVFFVEERVLVGGEVGEASEDTDEVESGEEGKKGQSTGRRLAFAMEVRDPGMLTQRNRRS